MAYSNETEFTVGSYLRGHPNIIRIDNFERNKPIIIDGKEENRDFIKLEYCRNGDLFDFISKYNHCLMNEGKSQGLLV